MSPGLCPPAQPLVSALLRSQAGPSSHPADAPDTAHLELSDQGATSCAAGAGRPRARAHRAGGAPVPSPGQSAFGRSPVEARPGGRVSYGDACRSPIDDWRIPPRVRWPKGRATSGSAICGPLRHNGRDPTDDRARGNGAAPSSEAAAQCCSAAPLRGSAPGLHGNRSGARSEPERRGPVAPVTRAYRHGVGHTPYSRVPAARSGHWRVMSCSKEMYPSRVTADRRADLQPRSGRAWPAGPHCEPAGPLLEPDGGGGDCGQCAGLRRRWMQ
jgi:hypothetical protein